MKKAFKAIGWFIQAVFEEFWDWAKFVAICTCFTIILAWAWESEGVPGKIFVGGIGLIIIINAVLKVCGKLLKEGAE
jgi:hypothetical protein